MKTVMFYEVSPGALPRARTYYAAHRAQIDEFHARGELLMVGAFSNSAEGAMGIFTTRAAAEEFVKGDPFVINGVVAKWTLRDWDEVLA
ncbi:MAG: YciI family protein [Burkholderiaceae bacterium]